MCLGLNKISKEIKDKNKFIFLLDDILSRLIYGRGSSPSSKRSTIESSKRLLEYKDMELHHFYRALEIIETPSKINKKSTTDYKRLVKVTNITSDGEIAKKKCITLDEEKILEESLYDGIYGISTNLDESIEKIININKRRWQIEECFKIMKSESKSRTVYLSRENRIKAHFITCFLSLTLFSFLEQKLGTEVSYIELIKTLRDYKFKRFYVLGYAPIYTRTEITELLHTSFGFNTDFEIISEKISKNFLKKQKNKKVRIL